MKRTALALVGLSIALTACSKHSDADNSSAANKTLSPDGNIDDNSTATNSSELDTGNGAGNSL